MHITFLDRFEARPGRILQWTPSEISTGTTYPVPRPPISSCILPAAAAIRLGSLPLSTFPAPSTRTHSRPASRNGRPVTTPCRARSPRPKNRVNPRHCSSTSPTSAICACVRKQWLTREHRSRCENSWASAWIDGAILSRFPRTFSVPSPARTSRQWSAGSTMPSATAGP